MTNSSGARAPLRRRAALPRPSRLPRRRCRLAALAAAVLASAAGAAERDFPYTWTSRTAPEGSREVEGWLTGRLGRTTDDQAWTEVRGAVTAGLLPGLELQGALEVTIASTAFTAVPDPRVAAQLRWAPLTADGVLGVGAMARASLGVDVLELELRLLADKQLGRLLLAVNAAASRRVFWSGRTGVQTHLEETAALRYALGTVASFGLELRLQSGFLGADYQGTGIYAGPTFTVRGPGFWASLGALAQVAADKAPADRGNGQPLELRDNERFLLRLVVGTGPPAPGT